MGDIPEGQFFVSVIVGIGNVRTRPRMAGTAGIHLQFWGNGFSDGVVAGFTVLAREPDHSAANMASVDGSIQAAICSRI